MRSMLWAYAGCNQRVRAVPGNAYGISVFHGATYYRGLVDRTDVESVAVPLEMALYWRDPAGAEDVHALAARLLMCSRWSSSETPRLRFVTDALHLAS